jgi:hypothetical protein
MTQRTGATKKKNEVKRIKEQAVPEVMKKIRGWGMSGRERRRSERVL